MQVSNIFREVTPLSAEDCFVIRSRVKSEFNYPVHVHPEFELNYIENAPGAQRLIGDSLEEIGDLLRHRSRATTMIYANLDTDGLRSIAQSWPVAEEAR